MRPFQILFHQLHRFVAIWVQNLNLSKLSKSYVNL